MQIRLLALFAFVAVVAAHNGGDDREHSNHPEYQGHSSHEEHSGHPQYQSPPSHEEHSSHEEHEGHPEGGHPTQPQPPQPSSPSNTGYHCPDTNKQAHGKVAELCDAPPHSGQSFGCTYLTGKGTGTHACTYNSRTGECNGGTNREHCPDSAIQHFGHKRRGSHAR